MAAGNSAPRTVDARAAFSAGHDQPTRPSSLIGESNVGGSLGTASSITNRNAACAVNTSVSAARSVNIAVKSTVRLHRVGRIIKILFGFPERWVNVFSSAIAIVVVIAGASPAIGAAPSLIVGIVLDQDGFPAGGAEVVARKRDGAADGRAVVADDGTFALEASMPPVELDASCRFCATVRVPFVSGADITIAVRRYRSLAAGGPSGADLAALAPESAAAVAELVPFAVVLGNVITDRGLGLGRDATVVDGLPLYRRLDGVPLVGVLPAFALADARVTDGAMRLASTDVDAPTTALGLAGGISGAIRTGGALATATAFESGAKDARFASARLTSPFAGGRLTTTALLDAASNVGFAGAQLAYDTSSRRYDTALGIGAVRSVAYGASESDVTYDAHVTNRAPAALTIGMQGRFSSGGSLYGGGTQHENRAYASAGWRGPRTAIALRLIAGPRLAPVLSVTQNLSANTAIRASLSDDTIASALGIATVFARSQRAEFSFNANDARRLSTEAVAYVETTTGGAVGRVRGVGLRAAYQIAPRLLLRSWLLRADATTGNVPAGFGVGYGPSMRGNPYASNTAARFDRQTAWLTWDGSVRFDLISRAEGFDASVGVRLARYRLTSGTGRLLGKRTITLTLSR